MTGVEMDRKKPNRDPYISIISTMGGPTPCLWTWDEEMGCHSPERTGDNNTSMGSGTMKGAIAEGKYWAECEEILFLGAEYETRSK